MQENQFGIKIINLLWPKRGRFVERWLCPFCHPAVRNLGVADETRINHREQSSVRFQQMETDFVQVCQKDELVADVVDVGEMIFTAFGFGEESVGVSLVVVDQQMAALKRQMVFENLRVRLLQNFRDEIFVRRRAEG